jgi:hypothetical protein
MTDNAANAVPLLGDIPLQHVQRIEHSLDGGFTATRIPGLAGTLQQNIGRLSHEILLMGVLFGSEAASQLETLQQAAAANEELTFAANITSALELQKVVITRFHVVEMAGHPNLYQYTIGLCESPPLPPPAQVIGFGGLDDFGLGDLGFDTDILGDLQDLAGEIASVVDDALGVIDALSALGDLGSLGGFLQPIDAPVQRAAGVGENLTKALDDLRSAFNG